MIEYISRYSQTDEPDDMGRWARMGVFNNIRICWIGRYELKEKTLFFASCHFPTMQNDTSNEHKGFDSFKDAKEFVEERWNWFLLNTQYNKIKLKKCECGGVLVRTTYQYKPALKCFECKTIYFK